MNTSTMPIPCDLSELSFADACGQLKALPEDVCLVCVAQYSARAQLIRDKFHCSVILIPTEMMKTNFTWGVEFGVHCIWSPGS